MRATIRTSCVVSALLMGAFALSGCEKAEPVDTQRLKAELKQELKRELLAELRREAAPPAGEPVTAPSEAQPRPTGPKPGERVEPIEPAPADGPGEPAEASGSPGKEPPPADAPTGEPVEDPLGDDVPAGADPEDVPADPPAAAPSGLELMTLQVAKGIDRNAREPVDPGTRFSTDDAKLYAYLVVKNPGEETKVAVEWVHGEDVRSRIELKVGHSTRGWRTWATGRTNRAGTWQVRITSLDGAVIGSKVFEIR